MTGTALPGIRLEHLRHRLQALGAGPAHERSVLRAWMRAQPLGEGPRRAEDFLPRRLRERLPPSPPPIAASGRSG